jgi:hypothetical protein
MIFCNAVSHTSFFTLTCTLQFKTIVQEKTSSQILFSTGTLSQVNIDSFIEDSQLMISQSKDTLSHAFKMIISSIFTFSIFFKTSFQLLNTKACFSCISISFFIASQAFHFDLFSKYFQSNINVIMKLAHSKK